MQSCQETRKTLLTFQPGVFCKSLILRRTSPQSSLHESHMRINPNFRAMKYLLYWYTTLMDESVSSAHEIWEEAYFIFSLEFHVSPATRLWTHNIFWGWRATTRNLGLVRSTRFLEGAFESIHGIRLRIWDLRIEAIWLALGSHWEWVLKRRR